MMIIYYMISFNTIGFYSPLHNLDKKLYKEIEVQILLI